MTSLQTAFSAFKRGQFVILHDGKGRENEADFLLLAEKATPAKVRQLRKDAGGLICLATDSATAKRLSLPFACDMLSNSKFKLLAGMCKKRMAYGDMPAFSISINHLKTFTGITDNDRAKTITEFGKLVKRKGNAREFRKNFRAIGHVFLLVGRGLENRMGHTELSLELARQTKTTTAVVLCEMLSDSGKAASRDEARAYAKKNNIPFIEKKELVELWQKHKKDPENKK